MTMEVYISQNEQARTAWQSSSVPEMSQTNAQMEALIALGEARFRQGDLEKAGKLFELVLEIEPGHERATFDLCELSQDYYEVSLLLQAMLKVHPENERGQSLLKEFEARCAQLEELEEMVKTSKYLNGWDERERLHQERLRYNRDRRADPITRTGKLLIQRDYITEAQLDTALNLQAMLARLGEQQRIGQVLCDYGYITIEQLDEVLGIQEIEFRSQMY